MRVVIATGIYPPEIGGPASYSRVFASAIKSWGDQVTVITYGDAETERSDVWDVVVVSRVGGPFVRYVCYVIKTLKLLWNADIIYLQGAISEGFPGMIAARLLKKQAVLRVPGDYAWEMYAGKYGTTKFRQNAQQGMELLDAFITHRHAGKIGIYEWIERWTARHAAHVIVPSKFLKGIVTQWGVPSVRISVIPSSAVPLSITRTRHDIRRAFGIQNEYVLFTAIRAVPWKGGDFLVELLSLLPMTTILVIAGDGPLLEVWKQRAEFFRVTSRCRFLGRIDRQHIAEWYTAADLFLLATGYEGFPHVISEAVSMGLPCFVSDKAGNPETKELYPDHVTVLPYLDLAAWREAVTERPLRRAPVVPRAFEDMAEEARVILQRAYADSKHLS